MEKQNDHKLFSQQLKTLWTVETMLLQHMPLLIESANSPGLSRSLALHFAETKQHKVAIEAICKQLEIYPKQGGYDKDIKSILDSGEKKIDATSEPAAVDDAIISSAIEIEQYEIIIYEQAAVFAKTLGHEWLSKRLYLTLEEEKQCYTKLQFLKAQLIEQTAEIGQH